MNTNSPADSQQQTAAYWRQFYATHSLRHDPSPFALWCLETQLAPGTRVLELGCGNGRDSFAFAQRQLSVLGVDGCEVAIADNLAYGATLGQPVAADFMALDFARLDEVTAEQMQGISVVYSRFVLHAIPEVLEDRLLDFCDRILPVGARMMHEFRTVRDPLMQQGEVLSANERVTDHYRRFLDPDVLRAKVRARGWRELHFAEGHGLAVFGKDDPFVARLVVEKTNPLDKPGS